MPYRLLRLGRQLGGIGAGLGILQPPIFVIQQGQKVQVDQNEA